MAQIKKKDTIYDKNVEQLPLPCVAGRNGIATLENGLEISWKFKYVLIIQSRNFTPTYLAKRNEKDILSKTYKANFSSTFIHNC